jgi:hypothetical protein
LWKSHESNQISDFLLKPNQTTYVNYYIYYYYFFIGK